MRSFYASLECLHHGVGFHHAGVDPADRRAIEQAFIDGQLPVLGSKLPFYCECKYRFSLYKHIVDGDKFAGTFGDNQEYSSIHGW